METLLITNRHDIFSQVFLSNITYYYYCFQTKHTNANFTGPARFKDNEFVYYCCCCRLRGTYTEEDGPEAKLIVNGTVLTKKNTNFREKLKS